MADKYARKNQRTREHRQQDAETLLRDRMPRDQAKHYAALLAERGLLESGDRDWAIALLADHMKRSRAGAIVEELVLCGAMESGR